jgi:hypothetical protein
MVGLPSTHLIPDEPLATTQGAELRILLCLFLLSSYLNHLVELKAIYVIEYCTTKLLGLHKYQCSTF